MDARAKAVARAKEAFRLKHIDNYPVPDGYDAKEYRNLRAVGCSDAESRRVIAARRLKSVHEGKAHSKISHDS